MKTAVHLHLYYLNQLPSLLKQMHNLDKAAIDYDLYVTMSAENPSAKSEILKEFPEAKIWLTENRGYDIGPFVDFLHKIDLNKYDYVLKLHTKNQKGGDYGCFNGVRLDSHTWAKMLLDALLETPEIIKNNFNLMSQNRQIGMLGSGFCLTDEPWTYKMLENRINQECARIGLQTNQGIKFIAGTMFLTRSKLLTPFLKYSITDFAEVKPKVHDYTLAHCLERMFGVAVLAQGYKIEGVKYKQYILSRIIVDIKRFLVQKKTTKNGKRILKICKIPVWQTKDTLPTNIVEREFSINPGIKRRLAIYAAYDKDGFVDKADIYYIRALREVADNVIYIADNELIAGEAEKISKDVCYIKAQKHGEYDFGSYKRGFEYAQERGLLADIDELILCNDSCYAPIYPFGSIFENMKDENIDFWGMTENIEISRHIQSYFIVFRPQVFSSKIFADFLKNVETKESVQAVIENYEVRLSEILSQKGFTSCSWLGKNKHSAGKLKTLKGTNPTLYPYSLLKSGCPLVKKKVFTEVAYSQENKQLQTIWAAKRANRKLKNVLPSISGMIIEIIKYHIKRFLYQKKMTRSGKTIIKICKLPIYIKEMSHDKS